jgi:nitrogen regulatory protein PII
VGNADAKKEADICFLIAGAWAIVAVAYVALTTVRRSYSLKMISCMLRPEQVGMVVEALREDELINGMSITKVKGFGRQKGHMDDGSWDGTEDKITFLPKIRAELVVKDWDVPRVMDIIREAVRTGNVGDGKIFVVDATDAMRIRTGERGIRAI